MDIIKLVISNSIGKMLSGIFIATIAVDIICLLSTE